MRTIAYSFTFLHFLLVALACRAQDSTLLGVLNDSISAHNMPQEVAGTFKATQIINTPTIESPAKNNLQFMIMHRFGTLNGGAYEFFGLDNAEIRFGLDYGLTNWLSIGAGRSSYTKTYDGSVKLKLLRQATGAMPVSVSLYELLTYQTFPKNEEAPYMTAALRTTYTSQLLVARKFSSRLSLQLSPAYVHLNMASTPKDRNDLWALGFGGRMKITRRMSLNAEYNLLPGSPVMSRTVHPSLSLGLDIETGGHIFQLVFTNSRGMVGPAYLTNTLDSWNDGGIYFGFNISRVFSFKKEHKASRSW